MSGTVEATKAWIRDLPSTNYRIFIGIWLSVCVILIFTVCIAIQRELQIEAMYAVILFLGTLLGLDVTQFVMKRKTEIVTPPQTTAEHATVTTVATSTVSQARLPDPAAPTKQPAPEAATAFRTAVAARSADPHTPVGELVDGEGD